MTTPLIFAEHGRILVLPPGFRFHPTDEELVVEYLKKKAYGLPLPSSSAITEYINLEICDPWYLPGIPDGESYFFTLKEVKPRAKIMARSGYWKATGKEMQIAVNGQLVGMKKAFNFYRDGRRTDWIMHEYRLAGVRFHNQKWCPANMMINDTKYWVACRVSKKKRGTATSGEDREGGRALSTPSSSCVTDMFAEASDGEEGSSGN